jgi:Fe-Mn family superoxide dismutase
MKRRKFVTTVGMGVAAAALPSKIFAGPEIDFSVDSEGKFMGHEFQDLPYAYDALEPYVDKMTMEIHYSRHHKGYYNKFLAAIKGKDYANKSLASLFAKMSGLPVSVRNNGGGYFNHTLFWNNMSPEKSSPSKKLKSAINKDFGSMEAFQEEFNNAAATRFGSGWAWLVLNEEGKLEVGSTPNQDNPLMDVSELRGTPLLALDVWEHAYYLKYQNKRGDYVSAFWNVVNWEEVSKRFEKASS